MLRIWPVLLLLGSNVFMTFAWYGHLKSHRASALWQVILASWGLAFFEYLLQVPANRIGYNGGYSLVQLKTIQEALALTVFVGFQAWFFGQGFAWNHWVGLLFIGLGAAFVFKPW